MPVFGRNSGDLCHVQCIRTGDVDFTGRAITRCQLVDTDRFFPAYDKQYILRLTLNSDIFN